MEWIAVEDELPEDDVQVLCWSLGIALNYDILYRSQEEWWRSMDGIWNAEVTHWQPLPDPPILANNGLESDAATPPCITAVCPKCGETFTELVG